MSALCQKRTHAVQQLGSLLDQLVVEAEQSGRHCNAERLGGFCSDGHVKFCRLHNRQIRGPLTFHRGASAAPTFMALPCRAKARKDGAQAN